MTFVSNGAPFSVVGSTGKIASTLGCRTDVEVVELAFSFLPLLNTDRSRYCVTAAFASVVVGVDGSMRALEAVSWAGSLAAGIGAPLRIVHAMPHLGPDSTGTTVGAVAIAQRHEGAETILRSSKHEVQEKYPTSVVTATAVPIQPDTPSSPPVGRPASWSSTAKTRASLTRCSWDRPCWPSSTALRARSSRGAVVAPTRRSRLWCVPCVHDHRVVFAVAFARRIVGMDSLDETAAGKFRLVSRPWRS
jgi:hypothetical protein